jgi:hypothetical protein
MDKPQVDSILGHPAGHRHRPDQPGAHLALDRRHHDRTERPPQAALRPPGRAALPRCAAAGAARHAAEHRRRPVTAACRREPRLHVCFPVRVPHNFSEEEVVQPAGQQGYTRIHARNGDTVEVVQDRLRSPRRRARARGRGTGSRLRVGHGRVLVYPMLDAGRLPRPLRWKFSAPLRRLRHQLRRSAARVCFPSTRPSAPAKPAGASAV